MPIYEYECECGVFELLAYDLRDKPCPECGMIGRRKMSLSHFKFKEGYPSWVDTLSDRHKREVDMGKQPTLPPITELK